MDDAAQWEPLVAWLECRLANQLVTVLHLVDIGQPAHRRPGDAGSEPSVEL